MDTDYHSTKVHLRERRISTYVTGRIEQQKHPQYTEAQIRHYLAWIAWRMRQHMLTSFQKEDMQPDWGQDKRKYGRFMGLVGGVFFALVISVTAAVFTIWVDGLSNALIYGGAAGISVGLVAGLLYWSARGAIFETSTKHHEIKFPERVLWLPTHKDVLPKIRRLALNGLFLGFLLGILTSAVFARNARMGLVNVLNGAIVTAIGCASISVLLGGFVWDSRPRRNSHSGDGLKSAYSNAILMMAAGACLGFLTVISLFSPVVFRTPSYLSQIIPTMITGGLLLGLPAGFVGAMSRGLETVMRHVALRLALAYEGSIPMGRYDAFLDYCTEIHLLRKVGGGYIFRHRMLMEFFAAEYEHEQVKRRDASSHREASH